MAARSHRQERGANPQLAITMRPADVEWRLRDLEHGVPETVAGQPRRDRVDFYFRYDVFKQVFSSFPAPRVGADQGVHQFSPTNSAGTERIGGIGVRIVTPICRFAPVATVEIISQQAPAFRADANDAILHLDMETGPARIYGQDIFEVHFGVQADWVIAPLHQAVPSEAILRMSDSLYATIHARIALL